MAKEFRSDINALRALSVTSVVAFHFGIWPFTGGFVGVDVFFVISGFLMTSIILRHTRPPAGQAPATFIYALTSFYLARVRRIVPAIVVMIIVLMIAGFLLLDPLIYGALGINALASLTFVSNLLYMMQADYFAASASSNFLLHTWSLSVEWQFYILYPIFLVLVDRCVPRHTSKIYWATLVISLILSGAVTYAWPAYGYFLLPTRAWEMMAGGLVVLMPPARPIRPWMRRVLLIAGLAAICSSMVYFTPVAYWPGWWAIIPTFGAVLVLLANRPGVWSTNPVANWLGSMSYSLYLYHWPIYCLFIYLKINLDPIGYSALLGLTLVLSFVSYRFVETPARNLFRKGLSFRALASGQNGFALAIFFGLLLCTVGVAVSHGVTQREGISNASQVFADIRRSSKDWEYPHGCAYSYYPVSGKADLRPCVIGRAEAKHKVAIFGDSFAEQLFPYFLKLAKSNPDYSFTFFTSGGCPPIPDLNQKAPGYRCNDFVHRVVQRVQQSKFETIVITSLWTTYFDDKNRKSIHADKMCFQRSGRCIHPATEGEAEILITQTFDGFGAMIKSFADNGTKTIVVLTMPYSPYDVPRELARRYHSQEPLGTLREFRGDIPRADRAYVETRLRAAAKIAGAAFYDPLPDICPRDRCTALSDKRIPLYRDRPHITASFARSIRLSGLDLLLGVSD